MLLWISSGYGSWKVSSADFLKQFLINGQNTIIASSAVYNENKLVNQVSSYGYKCLSHDFTKLLLYSPLDAWPN